MLTLYKPVYRSYIQTINITNYAGGGRRSRGSHGGSGNSGGAEGL